MRSRVRLPGSAAGLTIIACAIVCMLFFTWRCWADPLADFGRELYVPWQVAAGKSLYRDIAYFNGPLSVSFNAALFRVFGASLMTLAWANILILLCVTLMFHRIAARMSGEFTATIAALAFVILQAIGQPSPAANYNFITPYSHEITHGLALSLAAILCLDAHRRRRRPFWIAAAGLLLGLVFLTKPEIFLALAVAIVASMALDRLGLGESCLLVAAAFFPPIIAALWFGPGALGAWRYMFDSALLDSRFYTIVRGTDDIPRGLGLIAAVGAGYLVLFAAPLVVGMKLRGGGLRCAGAGFVAFVLSAGILGAARAHISWPDVARPLPIVLVIALVAILWRRKNTPDIGKENDPHPGRALSIVFFVFATALLLKMILHVVLYHYGFALAAPALVAAVVAAVGWAPKWVSRRAGCAAVVRYAALGALFTTCLVYLSYASDHSRFAAGKIAVGTGPNTFFTDARGQAINQVLETLDRQSPGASLAVVPQGAMINFLSGRQNSTPFIVLMPPEVLMFKDQRITAAFVAHPPDLVLVVRSDLAEYGYRSLADYSPQLVRLIDENYQPIEQARSTALPWTLLHRRS
jgi:hypothetical protein